MLFKCFLKECKLIISRYKHNWAKPVGFDTGIKVYNCVTRNKEPLILPRKNIVTWYTCGPTVYDSSHIGHASCYVKLDILQRILSNHFQCNIVTVMNITDIDDKIIKRANELKCSYSAIANKYEEEFWNDMKDLGVKQPNMVIKVTENMNLIVDFIKQLENTGQAYKGNDSSVYFDVSTCHNYGKLQNIGTQHENKKSSVKRSNLDFALWKQVKDDEPFWESPWGRGRPGWHIECSALASYILGSNIDIHSGGIDLRFPHHENEEVQSCAFHNTNQWVNYWFHTGYLHKKDSEKMSKSLKNTVSIQDMLEKTSPQAFRMACVMSHYRSNMELSEDLLKTADNLYNHYKNFLISCDDYTNNRLKGSVDYVVLNDTFSACVQTIHDALCDDFDTPSVIKALNNLSSKANSMFHSSSTSSDEQNNCKRLVLAIQNLVIRTLNNFGLDFNVQSVEVEELDDVMDILNEFRQSVRSFGIDSKNKELLNFCDKVRDDLKKCGITIRDHGKISSWSA